LRGLYCMVLYTSKSNKRHLELRAFQQERQPAADSSAISLASPRSYFTRPLHISKSNLASRSYKSFLVKPYYGAKLIWTHVHHFKSYWNGLVFYNMKWWDSGQIPSARAIETGGNSYGNGTEVQRRPAESIPR